MDIDVFGACGFMRTGESWTPAEVVYSILSLVGYYLIDSTGFLLSHIDVLGFVEDDDTVAQYIDVVSHFQMILARW